MPSKYTTAAGDVWDMIALRQMGSEAYTYLLMQANRQHVGVSRFSAGTVLTIPDVPRDAVTYAPPWRRKT
ncbi:MULTISPECIES: phage tail protein [unclassified Veillonella]|uniref:phage tail protein n=1 Tax=unclassified Veillonella TaxID=2630086 RepID=UPI001FF68B59|nr:MULTISPECIES: phage tail protein [unclassified Veillonella]MCK0528923.1 phage tail protein [Veillonella sp. KGMB01456]